jgi:anti-sigma-K factor RskA
MTEDDELLAAEYALGLLSPDEARAAEARMKLDAPLSLRVAWWRDQLSPLVDQAAVEPSADLWTRIEAQLGANDNVGGARRWKWATAGMSAVAASLLAIIVLRPGPPPPAPIPVPTDPQIVASLSGERGSAVTVAFHSETGRLLVTPVALDPGKGDAELWIIPLGETVPISMGVIDARAPVTPRIDAAHAALLKPGATFAISQEDRGGSPTGKPQGPIIATGKIIRV